MTESGGVQLSNDLVIDLQAMHQHRVAIVHHMMEGSYAEKKQRSNTVFIIEDSKAPCPFHLDEEMNLIVCNEKGVTDYFLDALREVRRDCPVVDTFIAIAS
jgi:hypothetical protein